MTDELEAELRWPLYTSAHLFGPYCKPQDRMNTLLSWWLERRIDRKTLRVMLAEVWASEDAPGLRHDQAQMVELFRAAGFLSDSSPRRRPPRKPLLVYRGCHPDRARGMAWTLDKERAKWFATDYHERVVMRATWADAGTALKLAQPQAGRVYRTTAGPEAVLAILDARKEAEVIVDPSMLGEIEEIA